MKQTQCAERWQVEAAHDGRLADDAGDALEQHLRVCECCRKEHAALSALSTRLREVGEQVDDELAIRRLRQPTLERANALMVGGVQREPRKSRTPFVLAACALAALCLLFVYSSRRDFVLVEPDAHAEWKRTRGGEVERVVLSSGTLLLRVSRGAHDPKLVVSVPDGEVEDIGTVFSVSVRDGRTREISVREGRVVFHRHGAEDLALVAGSTWTAASEASVEPPAQAAPAAEPVTREEPTKGDTQGRALEPRRGHRAAPAVHSQAAATDSEDALYLEIVSLLRAGRSDDAKREAVRYLRDYPTGFRVVEVLRVANAP